MAAPPSVPTVPNTPLSNRYRKTGYANARLPSGPCNYTNLNIGGGAKCGCRRFTDNTHGAQVTGSQLGLCVCAHHSCFHDLQGDGMSPTVDVPMTDDHFRNLDPSTPIQPRPENDHTEVGPHRGESLPDTLQWGRFINAGPSQDSLPAIPSECLLPSDNGSRTSGSQTGQTRPFAGLGLQTLSHLRKTNSTDHRSLAPGKNRLVYENGKFMQTYQDSNGHGRSQSLTEVATPSMRSSQDADPQTNFVPNGSIVQGVLQKLADERSTNINIALRPPPEDATTGPKTLALLHDTEDDNLLVKLENHELRLDQLENTSFSQQLLEEVRDGYDHLETLFNEHDERLAEAEKQLHALNDASSVGSRPPVNSSIDSRISASSSTLVANAIDRLDHSRIVALEAQISELQSVAPPSHSRPWEVEVVFLPFGPRLTGIWSTQLSMTRPPRMSLVSDDDWPQTPHNLTAAAQANLTAHDQSVAWDSSAANDSSRPWLMPRACGLRSKVDSRLRSRGLVKIIQVQGPDARDVQAAMLAAFGKLLDTIAEDPYSHNDHKSTIPQSLNHYIGLQPTWVPLRKVHKDSCLRFLNTSEMVTPALWNAQFLSSSVAMRATGMRRLYVTHPDSYIQHPGTTTTWTWQKLRQLDRVYPDSSFYHTPEADAHEPCWEFDERLDPPPSVHSSIESHLSLTIRPMSREKAAPTSTSDSSSPASHKAFITPISLPARPNYPASPLKERRPSRPLHIRTASMPSLIPLDSPSQPKRRIASFDHDTQSSPTRLQIFKRVRTRSPSRPRDTPRWSIGPPSPYPEEFVDMKRATTPFAYATPHSSATYIIERRISGEFVNDDDDEQGSRTEEFEGGERNALSDYDSISEEQSHQPKEEWEGVQESDSRIAGKVAREIMGESLRPDEEDSEDENSSCPSEYPSTQPPGLVSGDTKAGFRIHVDEEVGSS